MAYKFPVDKCSNCGDKLSVGRNTPLEERPKRVVGHCPKCFVAYTMEEVYKDATV